MGEEKVLRLISKEFSLSTSYPSSRALYFPQSVNYYEKRHNDRFRASFCFAATKSCKLIFFLPFNSQQIFLLPSLHSSV